MVLIAASVMGLSGFISNKSVIADTVDKTEISDVVETDPLYYKFVGRLYSIVLRKQQSDPV